MERTSFGDVADFCAVIEVIVDAIRAPVIAAVGEFIRTFDDIAAAEAEVVVMMEAGGCFCWDGVETATTDDVMTCGCDVTDWLGAVAAIGGDDVDMALDDITNFWEDGGSLLDVVPACSVVETTVAVCLCDVVTMGVDAGADNAGVVGVVGDVTCGIRSATFTAPGAFRVSAGIFPATGEVCGDVTKTASAVDDFCVVGGTCAVPDL